MIRALALFCTAACAAGFAAQPRLLRAGRASPVMAADMDGAADVSRRGALQKGLGALAVAGIVGNKVAVEGPPVYTPAGGSLSGRVIVITGANVGLGYESAVRLAKGGATIVITTRTAAKGEAAVEAIKRESGNPNVHYFALDLADLKSIDNAPAAFKQLGVGEHVDVLMNNAGVMAIPEYQTTKDGFEKQFGVNHLGHFALTAKMLPLLNPKGSRVIAVASSAHLGATAKDFEAERLGMGEGDYTQWGAYCRSKLANVLFAKELDRRFKAAGRPATAVSLHPGAVRTELARYLVTGGDNPTQDGVNGNPLAVLPLLVGLYFTKGVDRGANSQVWLAAGADGSDYQSSGGEFFQNLKPGFLNPAAKDAALAEKLWRESEALTGVKFDLQ